MAAPVDFHVQFDVANALKYYRWIATIIASAIAAVLAGVAFLCLDNDAPFAALTSDRVDSYDAYEAPDLALFALLPILVIGAFMILLLLVVAPLLARKIFDAQRCTVTATQILSESGWLNRTTQAIPLDRIQDLSVKQGFLQQRFALHTIEIQTAGSPSPFPEAVLYAPKDAQRVREEIMRRRDALLLGKARTPASADDAATATSAPASGDQSVVDALTELNRTMLRIEKLLSKDTGH